MPGFRATMMAYHSACLACTLRIVRLIALTLDLPPDFFDQDFTRPIVSLRPLHYSAVPSAPEQVAVLCCAGSCAVLAAVRCGL